MPSLGSPDKPRTTLSPPPLANVKDREGVVVVLAAMVEEAKVGRLLQQVEGGHLLKSVDVDRLLQLVAMVQLKKKSVGVGRP